MSIDQTGLVDWRTLPSVSINNRGDLPRSGGIYFAAQDDAVLYIGQSTNIYTRWMSHHKWDDLWPLEGVRIHWLDVTDPAALSSIERLHIKHHRPALNGGLGLPGEVGKLSIAPIQPITLVGFEDWYLTLKRQRRTLKRYHVMQAIMEAVLESPTVQAEVISRLK